MSAFEDAVIQRIKQLEREVERLQRWERPIGGEGGVTDHGDLTGLLDDDHSQYLNNTRHDTTDRHTLGTVVPRDSTKADDTAVVHKSGDESVGGIKTFTSFPVTPSSAPTSDYQAANKKYVDDNAGSGGVTDHGWLTGLLDDDHPQYLLRTDKAADSDKLDGVDGAGYVNTSAAQTIAGEKTFSSIPVLPSTNPTLTNHAVRKGYADATYLGISAKAADSDKLDGVDITAFKGLHSLTEPKADRVLFWDGSALALKWLTLGTGLTITDTTVIAERTHIVTANDTWNFKPEGTDLFIVDSMSLSNVVVPTGHNLLVEFDAIGYFSDIYGANIYLYNGTTLMFTFGAPMRMNVASARAGFHYSYRITSAGTYNLSIQCTANGHTSVDMDFLTRSLKATVIQE